MSNVVQHPTVTALKNAGAPSRMSLANVTSGKLDTPVKALAYGPDGVGKSSWASGAPSPIWLPLDNRTSKLNIKRLPQPLSWDEAMDGLRILETEKHDYRTVVVDPVNWLEPLLAAKLTGDPLLDLTNWKSFNKGWDAAVPHWRAFVYQLDRLHVRGMNVLLIAHCNVRPFNDPEGPGYDRYEIALEKKAAGLLKQWNDYVLFMKQEAVGKIDPNTKRARGQETGRRLIHTTWTAAYDAKFAVSAPTELELSWKAFHEAISAGEKRVEELRERVEQLCTQLDAATVKKVREYVADAKGDANRLDEIVNAVLLKIDESKAAAEAAKGQST